MYQPILTIPLISAPYFEMIFVEGGEFLMGDEKRKVKVNSFYLGKHQVTQALWQSIIGNNPSHFKGDNRPVESVSWNDAKEFLIKLRKITGQQFRLPSEAEWEFAGRGGVYSQGYEYCGSDKLKQVGWYNENSNNETHDVGLLLANELGIYDMSGNVWEWCEDKVGVYRVLRGGGSFDLAGGCRPTRRPWSAPGSRDGNFGFRLALSPQSVG